MYTVSIRMHGTTEKRIRCSSLDEAMFFADQYWYKELVIIDESTGEFIPVRG